MSCFHQSISIDCFHVAVSCTCIMVNFCYRYQVQTVLLTRATGTKTSDASLSLDSLISSGDEMKSQSSRHTCSNTAHLSSTFSNNVDDDAGILDAAVSSRLLPDNGTKERDVLTIASFKQKVVHSSGSQTHTEECSNSKEDHSSNDAYGQSIAFSSTDTGISQELALNHLIKDEARLSNTQVQCKVKRYGLRQRMACGQNNGPQKEVPESNGDVKKVLEMDSDNGTMGDQNRKRNSSLTPSHCLVLKQPVCCICGLSFPSTADCITHWRRDHIVTNPSGNTKPHLACNECPMQFAVPTSRIDSDLHVGIQVARWLNHAVRVHHFAVPSAVEKFVCPEPGCSFYALTPASYQIHQQKNRHGSLTGHSTSTLVYFELCCFLCTAAEGGREIFPSKPALQEHILKMHAVRDEVREVLQCPVCKDERPLIRARADDGDRCRPTSCGRFFYVVYRLLHHLVSKHGWSIPEYIQSFRCKFPGCQYTAVAQSDLDNHSISHDVGDGSAGSQNPSLPCEKCGKMVKFRAMRSHLRLCQVSLKDRQTQPCPYCNTRLSSQYNLRYHIKAVHSGTSTSKQFLCSYCTYSCHHKSNLEEHIFHRHGSNVSRRTVVACVLCPFKTIKPGALRRHVSLVHNDAKTFRCPVCDKTFKCQCE